MYTPDLNVLRFGLDWMRLLRRPRHIPTYIKDDLALEEAEKKKKADELVAEQKAKREAAAALRTKVQFMVCHADKIHTFAPDQTDSWGATKANIFSSLGMVC